MANIFQRLLSRGLQNAPRIADDVVESKAIQKLATEAGEEAPEVIGKATRRAAKEAGEEIPEAAFKEVTPTTGMSDMSLWNRLDKKKAAALLGLGGVGAGLMLGGGGDEQPPMAPVEPIKPVEPVKPEEAKVEAKKTVATEAPKKDGLDFDALAKKFDDGMAGLPKDGDLKPEEETINFRKLMEEALKSKESGLRDAGILRSSELLGSGLARIKADHSGSEIVRKRAGERITEAEKVAESITKQSNYDKAQAELGDEKAMRDSKSEISKLVSDLAIKTGLIKPGQSISAMKNAGVNLGTLLSTIEAGKARKEAAELARAEKIKSKEDKLSDTQRRFVQGLRKEATTGVLGKQYATFSTGQRMQSSLEQFAKNPSGYKDYATLMGGLKSLQGDESVVREAEVRLGMSATSAINKALNSLQRAMTGESLQPEQRQQMIDTIEILTKASKEQYIQSVKPILEQAQLEGIDPNLILSGSLSSVKDGKQEGEAPKTETRTFKQQLTPGSIVTTKSGKRYKIGADGVTGKLL
jgi:hypothetical protein